MLKTALIILFIGGAIFSGEDIAWSDSFIVSDNTPISLYDMAAGQKLDLIISKNSSNSLVTISVLGLIKNLYNEIKIFTIKGELVTLFTSGKEGLPSVIRWDISAQASGIYIISFTTGTQSVTRQLALVK